MFSGVNNFKNRIIKRFVSITMSRCHECCEHSKHRMVDQAPELLCSWLSSRYLENSLVCLKNETAVLAILTHICLGSLAVSPTCHQCKTSIWPRTHMMSSFSCLYPLFHWKKFFPENYDTMRWTQVVSTKPTWKNRMTTSIWDHSSWWPVVRPCVTAVAMAYQTFPSHYLDFRTVRAWNPSWCW